MKYVVYVLFSAKLGKKYIGKTVDLKQRLLDHNRGVVPFTKRGSPWKLIYYQVFLSQIDAGAEELFLKSGKGRERLSFLLRDTMSHLHD